MTMKIINNTVKDMINHYIEYKDVLISANEIKLANQNKERYEITETLKLENLKFNEGLKQGTLNIGIDFPENMYVFDNQNNIYPINLFPEGSAQFYYNNWRLLNQFPVEKVKHFVNDIYFQILDNYKLGASRESCLCSLLYIKDYKLFEKSDFDYSICCLIDSGMYGLIQKEGTDARFMCATDKNENYGLGRGPRDATLSLLSKLYDKNKIK